MLCPQCQRPVTQVGNFWVCQEHGVIPPERLVADTAAARRGTSVFISYGRADGLAFARRLADDLKSRGGYQVWMDLENIEVGGLFEVRIEQGIRAASVVVAVMTRHSLREESVCRDEVVFALNEGKSVVPLRIDPDPQLKPSLLLARRNWIDFSQNYDASLAALLAYLGGDERALRTPLLPTVTGTVPLDFGPEIARFARGFTGRQWLATEIDRWLATSSGRALVIIGAPGVGKSAIAAWLVETRREQVVGVHFCTHRNSRTLDPNEFVACLAGQLAAQLPGYLQALEARHPEVRRPRAADAFRELIVEPVRCLAAPPAPLLIVVDSLDEALGQDGETIVDVLVSQADDLPAWLKVIATTRPEERVLARIRRLGEFQLRAQRPENLQDTSLYVRSRLAASRFTADMDALADRLATLAEGNFLYARMALDALDEGRLAPSDLGQMTPGLADFYASLFRRTCPDIEAFARDYQPLLKALVAAQAPLPLALLHRVSGTSRENVHRRLLALRSCLRISGAGTTTEYAFFHKSLCDWLTDLHAAGEYWCDSQDGHASLARALSDELHAAGPARADNYSLQAYSQHLYRSGNLRELVANVGAPFLQQKLLRFGYGVLDDLEWLTRAMLDLNDPALVERCVALLDDLRRKAGGDLLEVVRQTVRPHSRALARQTDVLAPALPTIPGLDLYVGLLPKGQVGADFVEVIPTPGGVTLAVGDAPGSGLKSAFAARFLANLLVTLLRDHPATSLTDIFAEIERRTRGYSYFENIPLTCAAIDLHAGVAALANAGQTYPVLYSARRQAPDRIMASGPMLQSAAGSTMTRRTRRVEFAPGDALFLFTDGLTEDHKTTPDRYGRRAETLIAQHLRHGASALGEAILQDWQNHPRDGDYVDDVSLVVAIRTQEEPRQP